MNKLQLIAILLVLPFFPGCGSAPPVEENPQEAMLNAVNDFAGQLEDLEKQVKNATGDAKKTTDALEVATKKLQDIKKALEDNAEKISKQLGVERTAHNTTERKERLEKLQERIRTIVPRISALLKQLESDKEANVKASAKKFREAWDDLRTRAAELDNKIMKTTEPK